MNIVEHNSDFIYFTAPNYVARNLDAVYVHSRKLWRIPISIEAIDSLEHDGKLDGLYQKLTKYREWVNTVKAAGDITGDSDQRLRPYQRVDVEFLRNRNSAGIFNEQRTGKTPTTLIAAGDAEKIVVVCPAGLKLNWQKEIRRWLGRDSYVVGGTPKKRAEIYDLFYAADQAILIIGYETLRADIDKLKLERQNYTLIADEVHRLRNYKTKQSKAVYKVGKYADKIYALTGTPAVNHPSDVFGILKLLRPSKFTSFWQFAERYFTVTEGFYGKEMLGLKKHREKEFTNVLNDLSIQRKRKDVMGWIPKVTRLTIPLELVGKQAAHYNRAFKEFMYGDKEIPTILAQLTRLRQICNDPALLELEGNSAKTQFIKEYINDNPDTSVIIFSSFTSYLKRLASELDGAVLLTGEQSQSEKQAAVDAIQGGSARVLLGNIKAAGVGFTLDSVDTIIFADRSYNPVDNDQAGDRFIPTRADKEYGAKEIIDLVMENTVENHINKLLDSKQNIISYVNNYIDNLLVDLGIN